MWGDEMNSGDVIGGDVLGGKITGGGTSAVRLGNKSRKSARADMADTPLARLIAPISKAVRQCWAIT